MTSSNGAGLESSPSRTNGSGSGYNDLKSSTGEESMTQRKKALKTSFATQANALLRKNLTYQARNICTNVCLIALPIVLCLFLFLIQQLLDRVFSGSDFKCGCQEVNGEIVCGPQYSKNSQVAFCDVPHPPMWPAFMQVPSPPFRAANFEREPSFEGLPDSRVCGEGAGCPATILYTGSNQETADALGSRLIPENAVAALAATTSSAPSTSSSWLPPYLVGLSMVPPGSATYPSLNYFLEPAVASIGWESNQADYILLKQCQTSSSLSTNASSGSFVLDIDLQCLQTLSLWRQNNSQMMDQIYNGYQQADKTNDPPVPHEYVAAYDWQNTSTASFNPVIYYNKTFANDSTGVGGGPSSTVRFPRSLNLATNAFVKLVAGEKAEVPLFFLKDFPKPTTSLSLDFSSLLGPLFYLWLIQLLYPVVTSSLVYEKEKNLRMMMKMHGLGDGPYWVITYLYFLALSCIYLAFFVIFGSLIGLKFFRLNDYGLQFIFYFVFANCQIALGFFTSTFFSQVKTATVVTYLYVFGTGLLGEFLFRFFLEDPSFSRSAITAMEFIPAFALYRGLYELAEEAFLANYLNTDGMTFEKAADNGFFAATLILAVEWVIFLLLGWYLDQVVAAGSGIKKHPLFFLNAFKKKNKQQKAGTRSAAAAEGIDLDMDREDVKQEREAVEQALASGNTSELSIICDDLRKVYPGRDGNPNKVAVRGMSLAVPRGECFGMLGPNGAGKTTSIKMMIGFLTPSSGNAIIEGLDIKDDMDSIYSMMGVCPQHDLLWEQLTGREHLLFYGRLKNLKGAALTQAVEESLKSVNLFNGGVGDKKAGQYSGGMKRRLSVAISLIGDPLVVYMDEPSTGLDPASRNNLWNVVRNAKKGRAIILTTHSMEEAEVLCDRLGIFVDGSFQCIGNPKQLTSRYGGTYVFTITTPLEEENQVAQLATSLSPNAKRVYGLAGTQKFEIPTKDVDIADVFEAVEKAKSRINIQAWGIANTTLEDVFITIAKEAQAGTTLT